MKSHIFDPTKRKQKYEVEADESSDEGEEVGLHKKFMAGSLTKGKTKEGHRSSDSLKRDVGSGSERGQGSSQFFPGSGFF